MSSRFLSLTRQRVSGSSPTATVNRSAIKKGFAAACVRAGIEDLRAYDLRHTFATRLLERGVHHFVISALLGHSTPMTGFGFSSRMTPGYAHATWDTMVAAVATLEEPLQLKHHAAKLEQVRKVG